MASTSLEEKSKETPCCGSDLYQKIASINYQIGRSVFVHIAHVNNPHSFYCQVTEIRGILNHIERPQKSLIKKSELGSLCLFYSEEQRKWIRGKVINTNTENNEIYSDLLAIDYGFIKRKVPFGEMRDLPYCHQFPPLAIHCRLDCCEPKNGKDWDKNAIESFKFCTNYGVLRMTVKNVCSDHYLVDLFSGDDIATILVFSERAVFGYISNDVNRISCSIKSLNYHYPHRDLNVGDVITVRVLSGKSMDCFYVAAIDDFKDFQVIKSNLLCMCKREKYIEEYDVVPGMPVVVFHKNEYHRGEISDQKLSSDKVQLHLVDIGTIIEVSLACIKHVPKSFLQIPPLALYCSAMKNSQIRSLNKLLWPGERFNIEVVNAGHRFKNPHLVSVKLSALTLQKV